MVLIGCWVEVHSDLALFCIIIVVVAWASAMAHNVHSALSETNQFKLPLSRSPATTTRGGRWEPAILLPFTLRVIKTHPENEAGRSGRVGGREGVCVDRIFQEC